MIDLITSLRSKADQMQSSIDYKLNPSIASQNKTQRRIRIAEGMARDGQQLQKIQHLLRALADLHAAGTCPPCLASVNSRVGVEKLLWAPESDAGKVLISLLDPAASAPSLEQQLRTRENALVGLKIPGFFPTPPEVIDMMLSHVHISPDALCCDPSGGKGDMAAAMQKLLYPENLVHVWEINSQLREFLLQRGCLLMGEDFLEATPSVPGYDLMMMNPPFEKGQDMAHIYHAFTFLAPGGRLISIAGAALWYREGPAYEGFQHWLDDHGAYVEDVDEGAFKKAFRSTAVRSKLIVVDA